MSPPLQEREQGRRHTRLICSVVRNMDSRSRPSAGPLEPRHVFLTTVLRNEFLAEILERMSSSDLPEWYLSGGCVFQTFWNAEHGFEPSAGILDYDLFYFDSSDLCAQSERMIGRELARAFAHLPIDVEARNQARVHLWYEREFGAPCRAFGRCEDGIDAFLAICCCFGLRRTSTPRVEVYAPHGYDDLFDLVVRPNPARTTDGEALRGVYAAKTQRWSRMWKRLKIVPWPPVAGCSARQPVAASGPVLGSRR
jgi:hypothetical protein